MKIPNEELSIQYASDGGTSKQNLAQKIDYD
jgi:hypothetical protein